MYGKMPQKGMKNGKKKAPAKKKMPMPKRRGY